MSVDFTFAQVGPPQPLFELMGNVENRMEEIGSQKSSDGFPCIYKVNNRG
jgi:hypothetical protein